MESSRALVKQTKEIVEMFEDDIDIGRISSGWDADTDFDALPPRLADVGKEDVESAELFQGDADDLWTRVDEEGLLTFGGPASEGIDDSLAAAPPLATEFESPVEHFPTFQKALLHFKDRAPKARAVRIDTDKSYEDFGAEKAWNEIERRLNELRAHVEAHESDKHGGATKPLRAWDEVLGAVKDIASIQKAPDAKAAIANMPQVPLTVPAFAKDGVKCWLDGENVIVSIRFAMPNGSPRIATMGVKPKAMDEEGIAQWAEAQGHDPITVLGALPAISTVATGKRLVRETAAAALDAQGRENVVEMDEDCEEPIVMIGLGENTAPLAALMYVQQRAEAGDPQAQKEMSIMRMAAKTPLGRQMAAPALAEANRRLLQGKTEKKQASFADEYAKLSAFV
jgi:hypothetical protein